LIMMTVHRARQQISPSTAQGAEIIHDQHPALLLSMRAPAEKTLKLDGGTTGARLLLG